LSLVGVNLLSRFFLKEVDLIHNDTQSGAAEIAENCLNTLKNECLRLKTRLDRTNLKKAIQLLLDTHPMATIENALIPVFLRLIQLTDLDWAKNVDLKTKIELLFATRREQMRIGELNTIEKLTEVLQEKKSILTFSHSSTIIKSLDKLAKDGFNDKEIFVLESRPLKEGERTTLLLTSSGFKKVHLGIDFAIETFAKRAEMVVLGADTIYPNGQVLNKIGSATIAKIFHMRSKEVIIAASPSKICLRTIISKDQEWNKKIPQRNPKEISNLTAPNLEIWNKYFEIIQPDYISSLIMDSNQINSPISKQIKKFLETNQLIEQIRSFKEIWNDVKFE
jgi:translation initiation factor 2B subunit (eIF-2B alpha/beta/delta family)